MEPLTKEGWLGGQNELKKSETGTCSHILYISIHNVKAICNIQYFSIYFHEDI